MSINCLATSQRLLALAALLLAGSSQAVQSLSGTLLVASPGLTDPRFAESVVLLISHGDDGAMGLVVNRPSHLQLGDLVEFSRPTAAAKLHLHWGGPVEHRLAGVLLDEAISMRGQQVTPGLRYSTDLEDLLTLVAEGVDLARLRVIIGYAGWGAGQLEAEISRNDWHIVPASAGDIFGLEIEQIWHELMRRFEPSDTHQRMVSADPGRLRGAIRWRN